MRSPNLYTTEVEGDLVVEINGKMKAGTVVIEEVFERSGSNFLIEKGGGFFLLMRMLSECGE